VANALQTGDYFSDRLRELALAQRSLAEVRGHGLMLGVEVLDDSGAPGSARAKRIVNGLRQRGVLIGSEGPGANVLKLRPPMCFRPAHADLVFDALEQVLADPGLGGAR
jgi:4-aminobutyrate aminotransferase-like enzyme